MRFSFRDEMAMLVSVCMMVLCANMGYTQPPPAPTCEISILTGYETSTSFPAGWSPDYSGSPAKFNVPNALKTYYGWGCGGYVSGQHAVGDGWLDQVRVKVEYVGSNSANTQETYGTVVNGAWLTDITPIIELYGYPLTVKCTFQQRRTISGNTQWYDLASTVTHYLVYY